MNALDAMLEQRTLSSLEAEQSVLGALMLENRLYDRLADRITARDFTEPAHAAVWGTMARLAAAGRPLDLVTLSEQLEDDGNLEAIGGLAYLADLAKHTPSAANATAYADIVADLATRRRLLDELANIEALTRDKHRELPAVFDEAQGRLSRLQGHDEEAHAGPLADTLHEFLDTLERKWEGELSPMGTSFGLTDLDTLTMGMHPGQLALLAGRPSTGKTAMSLNTVRRCCLHDRRPVAYYSLEMPREALRDRLLAAEANMPLEALRNPKEHLHDDHWTRLTMALPVVRDAPLWVDERGGMSPSQIRSSAKRVRDHYGDLGLIVVDYLQLVRPDGRHGSREQEVAEVSRALKALAKEMGCPVMALSQLNRALEQRPNKRPVMADLRDSGSLEQDADLIVFLYRDEVYHPESEAKGIAEVIVAKQREGSLGTVMAASRLAHGRFDDLSPDALARMQQAQSQPAARMTSVDDVL